MNTDTPKLFLTDYASYNEGTQFEFGHWVDLDQFSDADEFTEYCTKHFEAADKKRPLDEYGSTREEWMFTDYENFPREFYSESMCHQEMENLFKWLEMDEDEKVKVSFLMEQCLDFEEAVDKKESVYMTELRSKYDNRAELQELFSQWYPEADQADDNCDFLRIDYDAFKDAHFTEYEDENGNHYLVENSWNY